MLDTDSRSLPPDEAALRVREASEKISGAGVVYKKIDSTLRGNVVAEVREMLAATGRKRAVIAPAFPAAGRTTSGGVQMVYNRPVEKTEVGADPDYPVRESSLERMFSGPGGVRVIGTGSLERSEESPVEAACGYEYSIVDATEEGHLLLLVGGFDRLGDHLWVGSAGLAGALSERLKREEPLRQVDFTGADLPGASTGGGPVLIAVGSLSDTSRGQLEFLLERAGAEAVPLTDPLQTTRRARASLEAGRDTAVYSPRSRGTRSAVDISGCFASVARGLDGAGTFGGLVLTGGDTAVAVGRALGGRGLRLGGEVEPGIPFGWLVGPRPYRVVTKAGGFGGRDALAKAAAFIGAAGKPTERQGG